MTVGYFGSKGELLFEIDLIASDGNSLTVEALFDTGFTDWLAINKQDAESLGWSLYDNQLMQTAQGEAIFDLYLGNLVLDGEELTVPVLANDTISEIILGLPWLRTRRLVVDFLSEVLVLGET
ncbi:aspartyl protease family protein [Lyngbya aestuarii]|uniref:aspartyl protease family protein n=1 Tax=Lyngbya aestuarii TaxID=118322 RepID=UPI00403E197F